MGKRIYKKLTTAEKEAYLNKYILFIQFEKEVQNMNRIIVLDISHTYAHIYDKIYYVDRDIEKYKDKIISLH